jgi:hypothetical protein
MYQSEDFEKRGDAYSFFETIQDRDWGRALEKKIRGNKDVAY